MMSNVNDNWLNVFKTSSGTLFEHFKWMCNPLVDIYDSQVRIYCIREKKEKVLFFLQKKSILTF